MKNLATYWDGERGELERVFPVVRRTVGRKVKRRRGLRCR